LASRTSRTRCRNKKGEDKTINVNEKYFRRAAEHHVRKAQHHASMGAAIEKCFGATEKAAKGKADLEDDGLNVEALSELLESFVEQHSAMADEHRQMAEACAQHAEDVAETEKATGSEFVKNFAPTLEAQARAAVQKALGNSTVPMPGISVVAPSASVPSGLTAVPRVGARPIPAAPAVPLEFTKLFSSEDGETLQ